MRFNFRQLKKDNVIRISISIAFFFLLSFTVLIFALYGKLPPFIPLVNNMPWGVERLMGKNILFLLPPIALLITFVNIATVGLLYDKNILMSRIVSFNTLLFNLLSFLAMVQIVLLVL